MRNTYMHRRTIEDCRGMTLVEVMVAMVIVSIISGIIYNVSLTQMRSVNEGGTVLEQAGSPITGLELIKRDLALAGYGSLDLLDVSHQKNIALYIKDGGDNRSDKLYLFDGSYIDVTELSYDFYGEIGHATITAGAGQTEVTLDRLDLDDMTSKFDDAYDDTGEKDEFKEGIWQYVISNSSTATSKVAKIDGISSNQLTLDNAISGTQVGPAVYYCVDYNNGDSDCHPSGEATNVLRRSSRDSAGRQPVAEHIVDMQLAYKKGSTWYCDGSGNCPVSPFYAGDIDLIRISLIAQVGTSTDTNTISMENGPSWGNDGKAYRVFTTSIRPRNNIEFD